MPARVPQNLEPKQRVGRRAQEAAPPEHHEERDPGDRMRHRERQVDDGGDDAFSGKGGARQHVGERHAEEGGDRGGQERRLEAEPQRLAHPRRAPAAGSPHTAGRECHQRQHDEGQKHAAHQREHQEHASAGAGGGCGARADRRPAQHPITAPGHGFTIAWSAAGHGSG